MPGIENRPRLSGEENARHDASAPASDGMRSVAQVPTPGGHSGDDGHRELMAITKSADPLEGVREGRQWSLNRSASSLGCHYVLNSPPLQQ